jgi:hypothetical protein
VGRTPAYADERMDSCGRYAPLAVEHPHLGFVVVLTGRGVVHVRASSCCVSATLSAAAFSSSRDTRFVPGM